MDQVFLTKIFQALEDLDGETSDQAQRDAFEIVVFYEFVKVDGKEFEGDDQVLSKHAVILNPNDIIRVIWVIFFKMKQNLKLNSSLMLELLFISNYLYCHYLSRFMINTLKRLSKTAFA